MPKVETINGQDGSNWEVTLPDNVSFSQPGTGTGSPFYLDGSSREPLTINVRYNLDSIFNPGTTHGIVSIAFKDIVGGGGESDDATGNGLRGNINIVLHNDLGVPLSTTAGMPFFIYLGDLTPDSENVTHPSYAHFHNVAGSYGGLTTQTGTFSGAGSPAAPSTIRLTGTIEPNQSVALGPFILHERDLATKEDGFVLAIMPTADTISAADRVTLQAEWNRLHPPGVISVADVQAAEGNDLMFTVALAAAVNHAVTVKYATSDGLASTADYTPVNGTLTFAAGETSKTVTVSTAEDNEIEAAETVILTLSDPVGGSLANLSATGTIVDNDQPTDPPLPLPPPDPRQPDQDLNGDAKSDILWRGKDGSMAIWNMDGGKMISSGLLPNPGSFWKPVGQGDFNGDGKSDLVWQGQDQSLAIWTMDNATVTSGQLIASPGSFWSLKAIADFDGDGKADIFSQGADGTPVVWNNGQPSNSTILQNPGLFWTLLDAANFNNDNKADLLWQGKDGSLAIWQMNGSQIASASLLPNPGDFWTMLTSADFNGDDQSDLLWRGKDGSLALWQMKDGRLESGGLLQNPGEFWALRDAHDYSGDGKTDLLWQGKDGSMAMWIMDGTQITSGAFLPNPSDFWSPILV